MNLSAPFRMFAGISCPPRLALPDPLYYSALYRDPQMGILYPNGTRSAKRSLLFHLTQIRLATDVKLADMTII